MTSRWYCVFLVLGIVLGINVLPTFQARASSTILKYDDGTMDQGIVPYSDEVGSEVAVRFTPTAYPARLHYVQFFVSGRSEEAAQTLFSVRIYDADNGYPGRILGDLRGKADNANEWVTIDVSQLDITITQGDFFVSMYWLIPSGASGENLDQTQTLGLDTTAPINGRSFLKWAGSGSWNSMSNTPSGDRDAMIRAVVGESSGELKISLDSWGVFRADDPVSNNTEYFVKVTDSEGISDDGSSHAVKVELPSGNTLTLDSYEKNDSTSAYYELWKSNTSPVNGAYVFTVTADDGRTSTVTDTFESDPISPVNYQSIQVVEDGTAPVVSWSPVSGAAAYRVNIYDGTGDLYYFTYWTKATSIKIRPGGLQPHSEYRCRIQAAREEKCSENIQNTSWSYLDRSKGTSFQTGDETTYPCEGLCYDDGTMSVVNQPLSNEIGSEIAVRFTPASYPAYLQKVKFFVGAYNEPTTQFGIRVYDDDNGDYPGSRLDGGTLSAAAVRGNTWVEVDVSSENIVVNQGDLFVSMYWQKAPGITGCFAQVIGNDKTSPIHAGTCWKWGGAGDWYLQESDFSEYGNHMIRAVVFSQPTCPDCSGDEVTLQNVTFPAGVTCQCIATKSMTIGASATVPSGATVTFQAPNVKIQNGFEAKEGSTVFIKQE